MDSKTDDMNGGLAPGASHVLVKSELTDERLGQEMPAIKQDPTTSMVVKQEEMLEEKSGVDVPSFGVDIQPAGPVETKVEVLNNCSVPQPDPHMMNHARKHTEIAGFPIQHSAGHGTVDQTTWRAHVSREERAQQIAVLYNLLKQKYAKNLDAKLKDQFVTLAQRVESAWFHKAEGKVCLYDGKAIAWMHTFHYMSICRINILANLL